MHKDIKRFGMEGQVGDDSDFLRLREQFEHMVLNDMRASGYVPVLGLGSFWTTTYIPNEERYDFMLTVHGIYVGKAEACITEGVTLEGKTIPRTPKAKSKLHFEKSE